MTTDRDKAHLSLPLKELLRWYDRYLGTSDDDKEDKQARRWLVLNDLFYLLAYECKREDMLHPWLLARCREVQAEPYGCLDLWAREHYKSTIITFGHTIQEILTDPNLTFGIFSHKVEQSTVFTKQIKEELETNRELIYLFPEILWDRPSESSQWTDAAFVVKRTERRKEPTVMACGILDGMPTGMHFQRRRYDDIVTEKSVTNPEMMQNVTKKWELSDNLGTVDGKEGYIGTRYHLFDTYRTMMDRKVIKVRQYPATSDGSDDCRKSVFMPPKLLAKKRQKQGIYTFFCQMLLNPKGDTARGFDDNWLMYWPATNFKNLNIVILVDPSKGRGKKSDYTAMWAIGIGGDDRFYVVDMLRARLSLSARRQVLFDWRRKYRPYAVLYEEVGLQTDIEHYKYVMEEENYRFKITPVVPVGAKNARIESLVPLFQFGRIFLPNTCIKQIKEGEVITATDMVEIFKREEYLSYPILEHDDMLDCLSQITSEEFTRLPAPDHRSDDYYALREMRRKEMRERPVV